MKLKKNYTCQYCSHKGVYTSDKPVPYIKGATYAALIDCPRCKKPQIITIYV